MRAEPKSEQRARYEHVDSHDITGLDSLACSPFHNDDSVVDPWHWLTKDGYLPVNNPRLYRRALRVARVIECGGTLRPGEIRETLVQCQKRPGRRQCPGLMWVTKTERDETLAVCLACKTEEMIIHNWQETELADGMMEPMSGVATPDRGLN